MVGQPWATSSQVTRWGSHLEKEKNLICYDLLWSSEPRGLLGQTSGLLSGVLRPGAAPSSPSRGFGTIKQFK